MAKIVFEPLDIIKYKENGVVAMALPCGKVITIEGGRRDYTYATADYPTDGEAVLVEANELPAEVRLAFIFAQHAFRAEGMFTK